VCLTQGASQTAARIVSTAYRCMHACMQVYVQVHACHMQVYDCRIYPELFERSIAVAAESAGINFREAPGFTSRMLSTDGPCAQYRQYKVPMCCCSRMTCPHGPQNPKCALKPCWVAKVRSRLSRGARQPGQPGGMRFNET